MIELLHTFIAIITDNTTNFPKAFRIFGLNSKSMNKLLGEENEEEEEREESVKKTIFRERKEKKKTEKQICSLNLLLPFSLFSSQIVY